MDVEQSLRDSISRAADLRPEPTGSSADRSAFLAAFRTWDEFNKRLLERAFTPVSWRESSPKTEYTSLQDLEFSITEELPEDRVDALGRLLAEKVRKLESVLSSLDLYESPMALHGIASDGDTAEARPDRLFLVHGRDKGALFEVQEFLERVTGIRPVVLSEQPSRGQTIIEKLGAHLAPGSFAVVLMTADDEGRLRGEDGELKLRARQNVLFELGFAVGRLERQYVAVLHEDGVELPSDYYGVVYITFDSGGGWKLQLVGELRAAGIDADANKAL
jgi:predicted nucleotide-binding protein